MREQNKKLKQSLRPTTSQRMLADQLQLIGIDIDKNAIQKIENGKQFVTDIEVVAFAKVFHVTTDELLK